MPDRQAARLIAAMKYRGTRPVSKMWAEVSGSRIFVGIDEKALVSAQ
jgi:hypothetical protein